MPTTVIQSKGNEPTATTTVTTTLPAPPTAGRLIVAGITTAGNTSFVFTPATPATGWTLLLEANYTNRRAQFWGRVAQPGESASYTFNSDQNGTIALNIWEVGSANTSSPVDKTNTSTDGGATQNNLITGSTGLLAQADELCLAMVCCGGTNGGTEAVTNGWTIRNPADFAQHLFADKAVAVTTAEQTTFSWVTPRRCHSLILTIKGQTNANEFAVDIGGSLVPITASAA